MNLKAKAGLTGAVVALALLAIPVVRHLSNKVVSPSRPARAAAVSGSADDSAASRSGSRAAHATAWKLPFRLEPRLSDEQAAILASGDVAAYLLAHPSESDLLVAWASIDPQAAERWLETAGEITQNGIGYFHHHLGALAAGIFAHGGIEEMQAFLEKHRQDPLLPPKHQDGGFDKRPWYFLGREDTGVAAIEYLQAHPEKSDLAGVFLSGIEKTDRMLAAFDYLHAKGMPADLGYWNLSERAERDGALLADWAAAKHPDLLEDVLSAWRPGHPEEVRRWIEARPELAPMLQER